MKDDPSVGCGVWPVILKRTKFLPACEFHDRVYTKESFIQRKGWTRKEVDSWFLAQMKMIAKTPYDKARAYLFYGIVRALGGFFYEGKK
jgi:hypothetical protein